MLNPGESKLWELVTKGLKKSQKFFEDKTNKRTAAIKRRNAPNPIIEFFFADSLSTKPKKFTILSMLHIVSWVVLGYYIHIFMS